MSYTTDEFRDVDNNENITFFILKSAIFTNENPLSES